MPIMSEEAKQLCLDVIAAGKLILQSEGTYDLDWLEHTITALERHIND